MRQNAELMLLLRDVELDVELDDLAMGAYDAEAVRKLFDFLEFRTLYDRLVEALDAELGPSRPRRSRCSRPRSPSSSRPRR